VTHLHFRDHQTYTQRDCDRINRAARKKRGDIILTTEKDMFKLSPVSSENNKLNLTKKVFSLPIKFVFSDKTLDEIRRHVF
jgi:tetraacyldisaccharide-1-P 4'-kinase